MESAHRKIKTGKLVRNVKGARPPITSIWETEALGSDSIVELLDEIQDLDSQGRVGALIDTGRIRVDSESSNEKACALAAAVIIAIWSDASLGGGDIVEDYSFIWKGISRAHGSEENALAITPKVFGSLLGELSESDQVVLENCVEAVK